MDAMNAMNARNTTSKTKTFREYINEISAKPVEVINDTFSIELNNKTKDTENYEIDIQKYICNDKSIVGYKFFRIKNGKRLTNYTKSKKPGVVLNTIKKNVIEYLNKNKPEYFVYISTNKKPQRVKRYSSFLKTFSKTGYYTEEIDTSSDTIFMMYLYKDGLDELNCPEVLDTINKI
jgi:hypothetical protein